MLFFLKHTTFFTIIQLYNCVTNFFQRNNIYVFTTYITYYMKFTIPLHKYYFTLLCIKRLTNFLNSVQFFQNEQNNERIKYASKLI